MGAVGPTITITFADDGSPALTDAVVTRLTAAVILALGSQKVVPTYGSGTIALAVTGG